MATSEMQTVQLLVRIVLALVFVVMGIAHFRPKPARAMAAMIPPRMRRSGLLSPVNLVRFTGVCEIAGGIGLLVPATRVAAAIALIVFLIVVFPANAFAAQHPEKFGKAAIPFWPRLIGQLAIIGVLVFAAL